MNKGVIGILNFALSKEIEGMNFYRSKTEEVTDPGLKKLLFQLSGMEKEHVEYLKNLISTIENGNSVSELELPQQGEGVFEKREKKEMVGGKIGELASDLSVVRMGFLIEDDFMKFYEKSSEKVQDSDMKRILKDLSAWEKEHRDVLQELYTDMTKDYWNEMGFTPLF